LVAVGVWAIILSPAGSVGQPGCEPIHQAGSRAGG